MLRGPPDGAGAPEQEALGGMGGVGEGGGGDADADKDLGVVCFYTHWLGCFALLQVGK